MLFLLPLLLFLLLLTEAEYWLHHLLLQLVFQRRERDAWMWISGGGSRFFKGPGGASAKTHTICRVGVLVQQPGSSSIIQGERQL